MPKRYLLYLALIAATIIVGLIVFPPRLSLLLDVLFENKQQIASAKPSLRGYFNEKGKGTSGLASFSYLLSHKIEQFHTAILGASDEGASQQPVEPEVTGAVTIAFLGDSMISVLGPEVSLFKSELSKRYPQAKFSVHNCGAASTDMEWGLQRLTNEYSYLGEKRPSVLSTNPDILVVESFAYNHWGDTQGDLDRQWLTIARIIDTVRRVSPKTKIVLAATIAPHCPTYTDGSANLPPERKQIQCQTVKKYLQNMVNFATSQHYPLVDVYHLTLDGGEGMKKYIAGDNIHPSGLGGELFAKQVVETLVSNNLLR